MICSIFMALRAIYFMSIILGDPVDDWNDQDNLDDRMTVSFADD